MREVNVRPSFWVGTTGERLRIAGANAQALAHFLLTCPWCTSDGVYTLPIPLIESTTGMSTSDILGALRDLRIMGFVRYDEDTDRVELLSMALSLIEVIQ